jgi:hypothetical protein
MTTEVQMLCRSAHCPKFEAGDVCESKGVHFLHFQALGPKDAKTKQICRPFLTGTCAPPNGRKCKTPHATHRADGLWELNGIVFRHSLHPPKPKADGVKVCPTAPSAAVEQEPGVDEVGPPPAPSDAVAPAPAPARRPRPPNPARQRETRAQRAPEPAAPAPQIPRPQSFAERARALKALLSQNPTGFDGDALDRLEEEIDTLMIDVNAAVKIITTLKSQLSGL